MGMGRLLAHPIISRIPPISALNTIEHCRKTSTIVNLAKLWAELGLKLMHDCLLLRSTSRSCRFADSLASESDARTAWGIAESSNQPILGIQLRVSWEETSSEDTWYTCHDTLVIHGTYLGVMILLFKPRSVPSFSLVFPWFLHVFLASWLCHEFRHSGWLWLLINIFDIFGFGFLLWWLGVPLVYIYIIIYVYVKKKHTGI